MIKFIPLDCDGLRPVLRDFHCGERHSGLVLALHALLVPQSDATVLTGQSSSDVSAVESIALPEKKRGLVEKDGHHAVFVGTVSAANFLEFTADPFVLLGAVVGNFCPVAYRGEGPGQIESHSCSFIPFMFRRLSLFD